MVEYDRFGGGSVLERAGISYNRRTDLYIIRNGALTHVRYRDKILHPIVCPYSGACGPGFIMMDDNARHIVHMWWTRTGRHRANGLAREIT